MPKLTTLGQSSSIEPGSGLPPLVSILRTAPTAFTIVEVLVAMAIIGVLLALLIPAVFAARESARRAQCNNNLRQVALACLAHESTHKHLPTGGWGFAWIGDPNRGFGRRQPGGWVFNVLPYLEESDLRRSGRNLSQPEKKGAVTLVMQTPLEALVCPSRRGSGLGPFAQPDPLYNAQFVSRVAKTDYAINAGEVDFGGGPGPETLAEGDRPSYKWEDFSAASGVSYLRSAVRVSQVRDGTSKTYLIGEKYVARGGGDAGDDQSMYIGYDYDTYRWTGPDSPPILDSRQAAPDRFGSAHPAGCHFAFADGSVRLIEYDVSPNVHRMLGNRHDGGPSGDLH